MMTRQAWIDRAEMHRGYIDGLLDGTLGQRDVAIADMTVAEAVVVERVNVAYCLAQSTEGR